MKVLIFGAAGTGKTTLGKEIAKVTHFVHLDSDAYYWKKTERPFTEKIPFTQRNENIKIDFKKNENVVVSGSMISWGKEWEAAFDLAVFIFMENGARMKRLKKREIERYGSQLHSDKALQRHSKAFLDWANEYDNPNFSGRTLEVHKDWIEQLTCHVLKLDGQMELSDKVLTVINAIKAAAVKSCSNQSH